MPGQPCSDDTSRDAQIRCNNYQTADFQGANHDFNVGMFPVGKIPGNMEERFGGGQKAVAVPTATMLGKWIYSMGNGINNPWRISHAWGKEYDWIHWEQNPEFTPSAPLTNQGPNP